MKQLLKTIILLPLNGMLIHHRVPSMKQIGVLLPPGWDARPSQGTQHEATIKDYYTTPPEWDASPSQDTQHEATRSTTPPLDWMLDHHRVPSMKQLLKTIILLPLNGMLDHHRVPSMQQIGVLLPPGWDARPSQGTQHEATIKDYYTTPPEWDARPSQGTQHEANRSTTPPWMGC